MPPSPPSRRRPRTSAACSSSALPALQLPAFTVDLGPSRPQTSDDAGFWQRLYAKHPPVEDSEKPPWFYYEPIPSPYLGNRSSTSQSSRRVWTASADKRPGTALIPESRGSKRASR